MSHTFDPLLLLTPVHTAVHTGKRSSDMFSTTPSTLIFDLAQKLRIKEVWIETEGREDLQQVKRR